MVEEWMGQVKTWEETVIIPTYAVGKPDKNPMFLEKRVYQGSSGVVYPYPIIDHVESVSQPRTYNAIFLENRYLKIMLLPELGGRVQMALDKTNEHHFVYYNRVIKPALVGLAGPWISGGIEFNYPQHHRPSTFDPVDTRLQDNEDGSKTVWFSEIERMFRTKSMIGFTLYPDAAYLELNVQVYNRTDKPQTFLWWANPAVHVNDDYQSVFPPDVHAVMDHGKRAVSDFPIATGTYYKIDYAPGTDISRYKNIPVPTSFMAHHSDFDFIGYYDHGKQAGMMHVANHHLVPGKKQWTWGNREFGKAWDRQLTDEDGPYIELMCGAFTDNQPDFSWLQPGEEKRFTQVFMPYKGIGAAKNASKDVVLNLEVTADRITFGVYVSCPRQVHVELLHNGNVIFERQLDLSPENTLIEEITYSAIPQEITLRVLDEGGVELITFTPLPDEKPTIPEPAKPAPPPSEVQSNEELYLHGLHLEQYRHATYAPEPYYEEALRRDPHDSRCNTAMGLLLLRRGKHREATPYFRKAIERLTMRNPNPYDGEAYYYLGLALKEQGSIKEAEAAFYKATWNAAWRSSSAFELAREDCHVGKWAQALDLLETALQSNASHHQARHLKIVCLRKLGQTGAAREEVKRSLQADFCNSGALYEQGLLNGDMSEFTALVRGNPHHLIEIGLDYANAGLYDDAESLFTFLPATDPMQLYFAAWCNSRDGDFGSARRYLQQASALSPDGCFPNQVEAIDALELAISLNSDNAHAPYYLGNFWYAHRCYDDAVKAWELSCYRDPLFATPYRNLGLAYMNKLNDPQRALVAYERAFELDTSDARVFFELDQLHKKIGMSPRERLQKLDLYPSLVEQRDDLLLERVALHNILGNYQEAFDHLMAHTFHPWEGGEGKIAEQYILSLLGLARQAMAIGDYPQAITGLEQARIYPHNLNEGKLYQAQENHILYYLGLAHAGLHHADTAKSYFEQAAVGRSKPTSSMYYNDQPPDLIFYQGLARQQLQQIQQAHEIFERLIAYGQQHLEDEVQMDYFAVSLPNFLVFEDDLSRRNRIHCHYMMALGYFGLGEITTAQTNFDAISSLEPNHVGVAAHRHLLAIMEDKSS